MSYERDASNDLVYNSTTGEYETANNTKYISNLSNGTDTYVIKDANALHSAEEALPSQTSQSGKFLTTNGTTASWANVPTEIPSQSGNSGKFLTTNGSAVSWASISVMTGADGTNAGTSGLTPQPAATDNTKFLKGDGTWADVPVATFYWNE